MMQVEWFISSFSFDWIDDSDNKRWIIKIHSEERSKKNTDDDGESSVAMIDGQQKDDGRFLYDTTERIVAVLYEQESSINEWTMNQ